MKVSLNWVKLMNANYGCSDSSELKDIGKLQEKIGAQLGAIEEVVDVGKKYEGLLVVKVVECVKHPNADKLSFCLVDDAGVNKRVKRNPGGLVEIVCGAPNVKAGQLAVWIPPGHTVPSTYDKEPFVIEAREIRGKISNGMLASPKELALGDNHEGILIMDEGKPGEDFAPKLRLDDYVIDIENKMFTHRPDCFGILGVARELAGINGKSFKSPDWYKEDASLPADGRKSVLKLSVKNELPKLVPRFCAVALKDVKVTASPIWLQSFLLRSGIRPINNIVDITNWFMMVTGQPLHAYDYDKVKTGVLGVRKSKAGERLALLNGKTIALSEGSMVITDGQRPIGLAGVMGGSDTEVDETTTNIIFECANFDMNQTRRTAMEYGLFTDAATRFTKNQSPRQNMAVLVKTVNDTMALAGGRVASAVIDDKHFTGAASVVKVSPEFINSRLGVYLSAAEMAGLLENVEFKVKKEANNLTVTVPFWRTDIEIPEDVVEEVGRLYGYDKLPQNLPKRPLEPVSKNQLMEFKDEVRQILAEFGANEVLTYSFVHNNLLKKASQDPKPAYEIGNALSPSLQYYRFDLVPSLLDKVHANIKAGYDKFAIFEIGKGHDKDHIDKDGLPQEFELLSLVYTASAKVKPAGAAFYQTRQYLDELANRLGLQLLFSPLDKLPNAQLAQMYEVSSTAMVSTTSGVYLGIIGELKESVRRQLKLSEHTAAFEIDIDALCKAKPEVKKYLPLPRFPQTYQDLCLRSSSHLTYQQLTDFVYNQLSAAGKEHGYEFELTPLDIYQADGQANQKQTTWRISLWHPERTLTTDETNHLMDELAQAAKKELKAERI